MSNLGIGQLAKRAGVAIDTVRYYARNVAKVKGAAEACRILNALTQENPR
jgi:hypothetical protein